MTAVLDDAPPTGYRQELHRTLGSFSSFAAGVSYLSILTGTFQLFAFGYGTAGAAYWWSWPLVFGGQLLVALCFAELAGRFPVAGSAYAWAKQLASPRTALLAGWVLLVGSVVTLSATVLALQATLPQIWSGFQIVGRDGSATGAAQNAVLLGGALVVLTTVVNAVGVRAVGRLASAGVAVELTAAVVIIIVLALHAHRSPAVVVHSGHGGLPAFLVAALASAYVLYGFDTAGSLAEETRAPHRVAPRAVVRALVASFVLGGLLLLLGIMAAPNLADPSLASTSGGLQQVLLDAAGPLGTVLLCCVALAICVCALAVHAAAVRVAFAMARDGALPGARALARVDPRARTPLLPVILVGVLAVAVLALNVGQPQVFTLVTSLAVLLFYVAYLLVTGPMLIARLRGRWQPGAFSLGRWGLAVNLGAVLWGTAMAVDLGWPREAVYDSVAPHHLWLRWGAPLVLLALLASGLLLQRRLRGRHVLPEHAC